MARAFALPPDFEDCIGIFQGGGCRAAAYAGAYSASSERGVNFDEVAGASAGSIAAVLIAAGASATQLEELLTELDFAALIRRPKGKRFPAKAENLFGKIYNLVRFNGLHDGSQIESWVETQLKALLPEVSHPKIRFGDLRKAAAVVATDLESHEPIVWSTSTTPDFPVGEAVRSSCTIPFFFQPHGPYVDGGVLSNLPLHIVDNDPSDLRRVLAFTLVDAEPSERPRDVIATAAALFSTVTEGGKIVQQLMHANVDEIPIRCGDIRATDFGRMDAPKVQRLVTAGRQAVEDFFGAGAAGTRPLKPPQVSTHLAQTLTAAVENLLVAQREIVVSLVLGERGHNWFFDLYTALLLARMRNVTVRALVEDVAGSPDSEQQVATLKAMGCAVTALPKSASLPLQAIICDSDDYGATAVLLSAGAGFEIHSRMFSGIDGDASVIRLITEAILEPCAPVDPGPAISLQRASVTAVKRALVPVRQYGSGVNITLEEVPLASIESWAHYAHVYKQRQQSAMLRVLRERDIQPFEPFFVNYGDGTGSLAMPIVVERRPDGRCTLVNGLSRLLILKREGLEHALCAVVSGVVAPPPAVDPKPLSYLGVRVGVRDNTKHRYPGFVYQNVRSVERHAHAVGPIDAGEVVANGDTA